MIYTILISIPIAGVLTSFGFLVFHLFLPANTVSVLAEDPLNLFFGMLSFIVLFSGANFGLELLKHKTETERQKQELKNEILEMEIDHLRTQLSPHFTFNILNNLQFLIRKDKDEALELLSRYSSILRYYVYESKNKRIQLNSEISFLKHYFQLEKGRSGEDLQLDFNCNIPQNELMIIPFVLSTFVENAFKHVAVSPQGKYFIAINIYLDNNLLVINIRNSFNAGVSNSKKGGVGLENAKKRLGLSYPDNYCLNITQEDEWFGVELRLNLEKA
jgi:LytS/YehU family sensor histidine kinase